ncbi:ABC transporter permease [Chryseolinea sp. H1M3-3]|uniref:ABC transporter permease n=1 Tax=Chryseolinea sp. H1M3-3 TaxID=3034144 RepID=UPI0023ECC72A|nr:ABC transporter permease [Chryseolinea sp. H1M3-3]
MDNQYKIEKNIRPPRFALRFLRWFCPGDLYESIEGDLLEEFENDLRLCSIQKARRRFAWNVIKFFRPEIVFRNKFSSELNEVYMLQNYVKVMFRNLMKRKAYSAINIFGLTIGLTFSMLIGVYVWQEMSVNQNLEDVDRLYIVEQAQDDAGVKFFAPADLVKTMRDQHAPAIENYYRFWDRNIKVSKDDKHFIVQSIIGDSTFVPMFGFPVLYGDINSALSQPYKVVITEKIALQFFNKADVVGESLILSSGTADKKEYIITAVVPALKRNSVSDLVNIDAQIFLSLQNWQDFRLPDPQGWMMNMVSYLKVGPGVTQTEAEDIMNATIQSHAPDSVKANLKLKLSGLDNYYLITNNGAAKKMIGIMAAIAGFILLLAIINFVNISVGSAFVRLKEIGVRKVIGGIKRQLVFQFLSESVLLTLAAGFISIILYELLHPTAEDLLSTSLLSITELDGGFWKWSILLLILIGLIAGGYPAFFMSSYKIIDSLKGRIKSTTRVLPLPKILVGLQFLIAICIFIAAIAITEQVAYFLKKDLGYDKSFVLTVSSVPRIWTEEGINQMSSAKQEFLNSPYVTAASLSWEVPNGNAGGDAGIYPDGSEPAKAVAMPVLKTDEDYYKVYGIKLLEGSFFYSDQESFQLNTLVINEKAQKALGVQVGDKVRITGTDNIVYTIKGIVNDFHFNSLRDQVKPLALMHTKESNFYRFFSFRIKPGSASETVAGIEKLWNKIFPDDPFDYAFMDEQLERLYKTELQLKKASAVGTVLMFIIMLTGIIGVVSLSVSKRTKEIGIRKVLGASVYNILAMISREYLALSLFAFGVAIPLAYYLVSSWLSGFSYRIELSWWMFLMPGLFTMCMTVIIVGWQSLKTALLNPTRTLKYE